MALKEILKHKKLEIRAQKKRVTLEALKSKLERAPSNRNSFYKSLISSNKRPHFICELKKASPSKGVIRPHFDPNAITKSFIKGGASAISVLTDFKYFQGNVDIFKRVRRSTKLPLLRKDFIIDSYQIFESKLIGADCILLIVAAMSESKLKSLFQTAKAIGLDVLVEVHNRRELQVAIRAGAKMIGINNRNLKTLKVDIDHALQLLKDIPKGIVKIVESGVETPKDVYRYTKAGADAFLIGTSLMRSKNITKKLNALRCFYGKD